jgi:hypothetical protein
MGTLTSRERFLQATCPGSSGWAAMDEVKAVRQQESDGRQNLLVDRPVNISAD